MPKDQQIRNLLATYYSMMQQQTESVADFSHRFLETKNSLEKLLPGIHRSSSGDLEIIHAFTMKLKPSIAKHLLSRDTEMKDISSAIEAAKRYESVEDTVQESNAECKPDALFASRRELEPKETNYRNRNSGTPKICWYFNKFHKANCELANNKCSKGFRHVCSQCFQANCKLRFHNQPASQNFRPNDATHKVSKPRQQNSATAGTVNVDKCDDSQALLVQTVEKVVADSLCGLKQELTTSIQTEVAKRFPPSPVTPSASADISNPQDHNFGMPAVPTLPSVSPVSDLDLANKHILWTKITSARVPLPLPLDSCCSISLVSKNHAETVAKKHPNLKFTKLEQQIPVSVAGPNSNLRAVGIMQVPIVWDNGKSVIFMMLVVPDLTWPILFGQNHLRKTDTRIRSKELKVYFADPAMDFEISCHDSNPLRSFPVLGRQHSTPSSSANVTCLLTAMPTTHQQQQHVTLTRGFNLVTVCLVIAASLVGSPIFSGPLWLEGTNFSPGLQTLSGPITLEALRVTPGDVPPTFLPASQSHAKSRPSQPIPPDHKYCSGVLASLTDETLTSIEANNQCFVTTVMITSAKGSAQLPHNISFSKIRLMTDVDSSVLEEAVNNTAELLSDTWHSHIVANSTVLAASHHQAIAYDANYFCSLSSTPTGLPLSKQAPATSCQDSALLSPFLEHNEFEHPHAFPPTESATLLPNSQEFFAQLIEALQLNSLKYAHVPSVVMDQFKALLQKYQQAFHLPNSPLSPIKGFYHNIETGDTPPVYKLPYRKSPAELQAIKKELERMLRLRIIEPSHSPWGAPCILVRKPLENGKPQPPRFVVDYRGLNAVTKGDGYPIPNVSNILDAISGGKFFAKLDLASGYWQVPVNPKHKEKTAFVTHLGLFHNLRLPFGLKTAPQCFQRILNTIFTDFLYQWLIIYIDNCITWSDSFSEALHHYEFILQRAVKFVVQFKPTKCMFFSKNLDILGHRVTPTGRFPTEKGTEAISNFPRPHTVSGLKRFLGMVGYFREYIPNMSHRSQNLCSLLSPKASFSWSSEHEAEFQDLKTALLSPKLMLFHPDWDSDFEVHTDASKIGCGAMLAQRIDGSLRPMRFASRSFNPTESRWPTAHQEFFAVKWALERFRHYLAGRKFKVITGHANLKYLASVAPQNSKLARWCLSLAEFDFTIEHRPGKENTVPDALSRAPAPEPHPEVNTLVIPPSEVSSFFATALSLDIPSLSVEEAFQLFHSSLT